MAFGVTEAVAPAPVSLGDRDMLKLCVSILVTLRLRPADNASIARNN